MANEYDSPPPSPSKLPSFESLDYWEKRYLDTTKSYDWLNEADILDKHILHAISASTASQQSEAPKILHVGCGNSDLSFNLRMMVPDPAQVHNVDYSRNVVAWGRERERQMFDFSHGEDDDDDGGDGDCDEDDEDDEVEDEDNEDGDREYEDEEDAEEADKEEEEEEALNDLTMPMMRWSAVDLTDMTSIITACELGAYTLFVDKSTSDCLACASVANAPVPYPLYTGDTLQDDHIDLSDAQSAKVSALQILAVHLALLARPRARWIVYSYSETRFDFFGEDFAEEDLVARVLKMHGAVPQPRVLWRLLEKETIVRRGDDDHDDDHDDEHDDDDDEHDDGNPREKQVVASSSKDVVQAPKLHFIYVFERSDVELKVRSL